MQSWRVLSLPAAIFVSLVCAGCPDGGQQPAGNGGAATPAATATPKATPAPKPFVRDELKTPWKLAKVGDWAKYRMSMGTTDKVFRFEVTQVEERTVTAERQDENGKTLDSMTIDLAEEEERYKDPMTYDALVGTPTEQEVEVAGKKVTVLVVKRAREGMGSTELWLAEQDVRPFMQCAVKSIKDGSVQAELLDFGKAGE